MTPRRLVLLGASNVANGLSLIARTARDLWPGPLEVVAALGHGRSYGRMSWVFWRGLPGILECGLWSALAERQPQPTAALVTDIGNDLLYDVQVEELAAWVEECLVRLGPIAQRVVLTELPLATLDDLSEWWYVTLRTVLFPKCRLDRATILGRARELNARVIELAAKYGAKVARPRREWYDVDPIHPRPWDLPEVWRELLAPLAEEKDEPSRQRSSASSLASAFAPLDWLRCQTLWPDRWMLLRREIRSSQPAGRLSDGTVVELY